MVARRRDPDLFCIDCRLAHYPGVTGIDEHGKPCCVECGRVLTPFEADS